MALIIVMWGISAGAQNFRGIKNWKYIPLKENFWKEIEAGLAEPNAKLYMKALAQATVSVNLEKAEAELAQTLILRAWGLNVLAYHRALNLIENYTGSMAAQRALLLVEEELRVGFHDDAEIRRLIGSGQFNEIPDELLPFAWVERALNLHQKGFSNWHQTAETSIPGASYWAVVYKFMQITAKAQTTPPAKTLEALDALLVQFKEIPPRLQTKIDIQRARVMFDLKKYDEADKIYISLSPPPREAGRILFERASVHYAQQDFSVSLGMLEALKTRSMHISLDPEYTILAMVAYRDLCHYPAVRLFAKDYFATFNPALTFIRSNRRLEDSATLMDMALQKSANQEPALEISDLNAQKARLPAEVQRLAKAEQDKLVSEMTRLNTILRGRMVRRLQGELKSQAERLLQITEQVKLLEYVSDLDEYRLKQAFEKREYKSEKAEYFAIDKLYWPVAKEYWQDENKNYRVLIEDRCKPKESAVQ